MSLWLAEWNGSKVLLNVYKIVAHKIHRYINITITILDIIHRDVFYLKHDVSETGLCLRL
jgi:hypothetical protein